MVTFAPTTKLVIGEERTTVTMVELRLIEEIITLPGRSWNITLTLQLESAWTNGDSLSPGIVTAGPPCRQCPKARSLACVLAAKRQASNTNVIFLIFLVLPIRDRPDSARGPRCIFSYAMNYNLTRALNSSSSLFLGRN